MRCTRAATRASRCSSLASTPLPAPDVPTSPPPCPLHPAPRLFAPLRVLTRLCGPHCSWAHEPPAHHYAYSKAGFHESIAQSAQWHNVALYKWTSALVNGLGGKYGGVYSIVNVVVGETTRLRVCNVCLTLKPFGKAASELFLLSPRPSRRHLTAISLSLSPPFFQHALPISSLTDWRKLCASRLD